MDELKHWFNSLPKFTKYWFGGTIATCLIGRFNLISPVQLILLYEPFINQFQIWRPITASLYYPLSPNAAFHFLMMMYFMVNYSRMLETGVFATRPADYATLLLFNWSLLVVTALILNLPLLLEPMVYAVLYIWSQLYADQTVSFFFGFQFQAKYFPWVLFGFDVIFSHDYVGKLVAFLVGHMYVFLKFQYQEQYGGSSMLNTPSFLESWLPPTTSRSPRTSEPEPQGGRSFGFGHSWGRGQTLGSN